MPSTPSYHDERRTQRTVRAARDLTALVAALVPALGPDACLVLHDSVDRYFAFDAGHLPRGTIDARQHGAVAIALAEPSRVLVDGGGLWYPRTVTQEPRWPDLVAAGRPVATIGASALTGEYLGLTVTHADPAFYRDGVAQPTLGLAVG